MTLTIPEIAAHFGVCPDTIYRWIEAGLPTDPEYRHPRRVSITEANAWLARNPNFDPRQRQVSERYMGKPVSVERGRIVFVR